MLVMRHLIYTCPETSTRFDLLGIPFKAGEEAIDALHGEGDPKNTGNSERAHIMVFSRSSATAPESRNSFMADSSSIAMSSIDRVGAPFSKSTQPSENLSRSWASSAAGRRRARPSC